MQSAVNHYSKTQFLTEPLSNNAFDYEERKKTNPHPQIYIPSLIDGAPQDVQTGNHIVFEAADDSGKIKSHLGLQNFIKIRRTEGNVYIIDNHNHAFYFWHLEALQRPTTLIHIDQHRDSRIPANFLTAAEAKNLDKVFEYTNTILNVGNFIPPAVKTGLIENVIMITGDAELKDFKTIPKHFILDIDLDFFAPELDFIDNTSKLQLIQKLLPKATVTTIATSPFFIDQKLALQKLNEILSP